MRPKLLVSGDRRNFTTLSLDTLRGKLSVVANYAALPNASWVELSSRHGDLDRFIGVSEHGYIGSLYTFEIDHAWKTIKITSDRFTREGPVHFITLKDRSAIALATSTMAA